MERAKAVGSRRNDGKIRRVVGLAMLDALLLASLSGRVKRFVCDTGPLVYLFEANLLNLLEAAGKVLMSPGVADDGPGVLGGPPERAVCWLASKVLARKGGLRCFHDWRLSSIMGCC